MIAPIFPMTAGGGDRRNFVFGDFSDGEFNSYGENSGFENAASFHAYVTDLSVRR